MPSYGIKSKDVGGGCRKKMKLLSRGLSLGTKYQARTGEDSDSSDDVDEKENAGKSSTSGKGTSRKGSEVKFLYLCIILKYT